MELNLRPLFSFAHQTYQKNPVFTPKNREDLSEREQEELEKIHQALSILQFKSEHQLLDRRPEFKMDDRKLLEKINYEESTIDLEGQLYELKGTCFSNDPAR